MRQIPLALLNMSAVYTPPSTENAYGQPTQGTAINLSSVYLEYADAVNVGNLGEQNRDDATLFFDSVNSIPQGQTFLTGGKITAGGSTFIIRLARRYYVPTSGLLHHWEIGLVGN